MGDLKSGTDAPSVSNNQDRSESIDCSQTPRRREWHTACGGGNAGASENDNLSLSRILDVLCDGRQIPGRERLRRDALVDEAGFVLPHLATSPARDVAGSSAGLLFAVAAPSTYGCDGLTICDRARRDVSAYRKGDAQMFTGRELGWRGRGGDFGTCIMITVKVGVIDNATNIRWSMRRRG